MRLNDDARRSVFLGLTLWPKELQQSRCQCHHRQGSTLTVRSSGYQGGGQQENLLMSLPCLFFPQSCYMGVQLGTDDNS